MTKRTLNDVENYFTIDKADSKKENTEETVLSDSHETENYDDLEKIIFGDEDGFEEGLDNFISSNQKKAKLKSMLNEKKAKWKDDDDEDFFKNHKVEQPTWATLKDDSEEEHDDKEGDSDEEDDNIAWQTGNYISKTVQLPPRTIQHHHCPHINLSHTSNGKVRVLEMMSRDQIALVGGTSLQLFKVGGKKNLNDQIKPHTLAIEKFPVSKAKFVAHETQVLVGSVYPSFVTYDLVASKVVKHSIKDIEYSWNSKVFETSPDDKYVAVVGKSGAVNLLNAQTKGWLHTFKGEAESTEAMCFSADSSKLYLHGDCGVVHIWCLRTNKCIGRFQDQGTHKGSCIQMSPCGSFLATGCTSGIVNLYDAKKLETSINTTKKYELASPAPLRCVQNLVSSCTSLSFNPSSEILAMASSFNQNSIKLLHINSLSVFSNFPDPTRKLGLVYSTTFSPVGGGYLAFGNHRGMAHLVRLKHYSSY